ncbi:phage portal protein [Rhizobium sp. CG5]|uniref:phage portal protein n=1 Tax=Rhizobium sp. CG5 TaxID=2726076 RepID=UPI002033A193|nr:phage portal protein [Rhizobium sp. CG5]MCM2472143.1 phage portal protein [Rhizobium sp. CG5]
MSLLSRLFGSGQPRASVQSDGPGAAYRADDPAILEAIRASMAGDIRSRILRNGALNRAIRLHCETIGMLPLNLLHSTDDRSKADDHPVHNVLARTPNNWQSPYEFKRLMHWAMLRNGAAYAQIVRSVGRVIQLQPLYKFRVTPRQTMDWSISYDLISSNGVRSTLRPGEVFAIRDLPVTDGFSGDSRVQQAMDSINLSLTIKNAAQKLFENGMHVGGAIQSATKLGKEAREQIKKDMAERTGADNAGKWLLLDGFTAEPFDQNLSDNQQIENIKLEIEEIGRHFGTPRPLLMLDDTSWGSGIEALGQFFVTYGLAPQFVNWEQAIFRDLLTDDEKRQYGAKFNEGALMRGSMKDQAEVFAKALGAGGSRPWMTQVEVRDKADLPKKGSDELPENAQQITGDRNVASKSA